MYTIQPIWFSFPPPLFLFKELISLFQLRLTDYSKIVYFQNANKWKLICILDAKKRVIIIWSTLKGLCTEKIKFDFLKIQPETIVLRSILGIFYFLSIAIEALSKFWPPPICTPAITEHTTLYTPYNCFWPLTSPYIASHRPTTPYIANIALRVMLCLPTRSEQVGGEHILFGDISRCGAMWGDVSGQYRAKKTIKHKQKKGRDWM